MARKRVVLLKEDFFPNNRDVDFLRVEKSLADGVSLGFVGYAIEGMPGCQKVRLDFDGYFYANDLTELINSGAITREQRYIFELAANEIICAYHQAVKEQASRKERILQLTMQLCDVQKDLQEVVMEEKRALIHEEEQ